MTNPAFWARTLLGGNPNAPVSCAHLVTYRCNLRCTHCYQNRENQVKELSEEAIIALVRTFGSDLKHVSISGGEPFLRTDLARVILAYLEHTSCRTIQIISNGVLTSRILQVLTEVRRQRERQVRIALTLSCDGVPDVHDAMRESPGCFAAVSETITAVTRATDLVDSLRVNVTLWQQDEQQIIEGIRLIHELNPRVSVTLSAARQTRSTPDAVRYARVADYCDRRNGLEKSGTFFGNGLLDRMLRAKDRVMHQRIAQILAGGSRKATCLAGSHFAVLDPCGRFLACEMLPEALLNAGEVASRGAATWQKLRHRAMTLKRRWRNICNHCTYE